MSKANGRKSIFITGAASGIGAETARYFCERGWFVGLYDIDEAGLAAMERELGEDNCTCAVLDVREREQWQTAVDDMANATGGTLDVLMNNAGIARSGWMEDIPPDDSDAMIDINLKGVVNGVYAALPLLKNNPPGNNTRIVNVASMAGFLGAPRIAVYVATKFAVVGFTEALARELQPLGITVTSLAPWFIDTPILEKSGSYEGANQALKDELEESGATVYPVNIAAERAWDAVHGKRQHYTVGREATVVRTLSRLAPWLMRRRVQKSLPERVRD